MKNKNRFENIKQEFKAERGKTEQEKIQLYLGRLGTFDEKEKLLKEAN